MSAGSLPASSATLRLMLRAARAASGAAATLPAVAQLSAGKRSAEPLRILIATLISSRTRDAVTAAATERLFALADGAEELARLPARQIERAIYPSGFYRTKARQISVAAGVLCERHGGEVPADRELLMQLPGVGRKTANLVLGGAFGIPAICVDTHVQRISNRVGWVRTTTPAQTEERLTALLPRSTWIGVNASLVAFGQKVCRPITPLCQDCPFDPCCPKIGA